MSLKFQKYVYLEHQTQDHRVVSTTQPIQLEVTLFSDEEVEMSHLRGWCLWCKQNGW